MLCTLSKPGSDLLSRGLSRSTIGAEDLNDRVRDGIGCLPLAMTTRPTEHAQVLGNRIFRLLDRIKPIGRLVPVSYTCCHASTPGLSTWWSTTALRET